MLSRDVHSQAPEQWTKSSVSAAKEITLHLSLWSQMLQSDYGGLGTEISLAYPPYHVYCYPGCMNPELQPVQLSEWDPSGSLSDPHPCWTYIWTVRSEWVLLSLIWAFVNWRCNSSQVLEGWEDRMQQTKYTRMQPRRSLLRLPLCHPCKIVFGEWCFLSPL